MGPQGEVVLTTERRSKSIDDPSRQDVAVEREEEAEVTRPQEEATSDSRVDTGAGSHEEPALEQPEVDVGEREMVVEPPSTEPSIEPIVEEQPAPDASSRGAERTSGGGEDAAGEGDATGRDASAGQASVAQTAAAQAGHPTEPEAAAPEPADVVETASGSASREVVLHMSAAAGRLRSPAAPTGSGSSLSSAAQLVRD